jgi:hypothetical protein
VEECEQRGCPEVPTYGILRAELEFQSVGLVHVDRIRVEDFQIKEPFFEAFGGYECYSWR